jgi:hypothetical protein
VRRLRDPAPGTSARRPRRRREGCPALLHEAEGVRRIVFAAFVCAACALVSPKESLAASKTADFVASSTNVQVHSFKYFPTLSGNVSGASNDQYYLVCKLTFTNDIGYDTAPLPKNFVLQTPTGAIYQGVDSGDSSLVGISNFAGLVPKDQKQDYTIAFRVPANTTGTVYYQP